MVDIRMSRVHSLHCSVFAFHLQNAKRGDGGHRDRLGHFYWRLIVAKSTNKKSLSPPSEEELQRQHERFMQIWKSVASVTKTALICCGAVGFSYVTFYLPILESHGETTVIEQSVNFLANINTHVIVAWGTTAAATFYGLNERRLRHKERAERDKRLREYEKTKDPNVTSSGLNSSGTEANEKP